MLASCFAYVQPDCTPDIVGDLYTEMSLRQVIEQLHSVYRRVGPVQTYFSINDTPQF